MKVPLDASPVHTDALLALIAMRPAAPGGGSSAAGGDCYLRTVHLDLSGQALSTEQLRELLHEAPRRLKQCYMLESLVLSQCQLAPGALDALVHWKALKALEGLRRLVLADNPQLGCSRCRSGSGSSRAAWLERSQHQRRRRFVVR